MSTDGARLPQGGEEASDDRAAGRGRRVRPLPRIAKYEIHEELGHGGMATVYRAHDRRLERDVAVKVLHPHLRASTEVAARFLVEARAVAKLRHDNILEVYDVAEEDDDERWLAVELVRGETLRAVLAAEGKLPPEVAASIAVELLSALAHAHDGGIIHRDVKPENVMVGRPEPLPSRAGAAGAEERVTCRVPIKLMDFGIAKVQGAQGVTSTGQVLGSPAHMAPEQIEGGDVDERVDVFAVGVLLYEAMVGALPFAGANPAQVLRRVLEGEYVPAEHAEPTIGRRWSMLLDRALAHSKDDRYPSATAMREALHAELDRLGVGDERRTLARWAEDRAGFPERLRGELVAKLQVLGAVAQRAEDVLTASQDYSRALALAPDDRKLLATVAGLRKRAERARLLRRALPAAAALLLLGGGSYAGTRLLRAARAPKELPTATPLATTEAPPTAPTAARTPLLATPSQTASTGPLGRPPLLAATPLRPITKRVVRVDRVEPPAGVLVALDGASAQPAREGLELPVDGRPHELRFSCVEELCEPQIVRIPEGERAAPVSVKLAIRPATLLVEGDKLKAYGVEERPFLRLSAGLAVTVPLSHGSEQITVVERETGNRRTVLLRAGKKASVDFGP